jgi:hypothetical protein
VSAQCSKQHCSRTEGRKSWPPGNLNTLGPCLLLPDLQSLFYARAKEPVEVATGYPFVVGLLGFVAFPRGPLDLGRICGTRLRSGGVGISFGARMTDPSRSLNFPLRAREETRESRAMRCLFLNTRRGQAGFWAAKRPKIARASGVFAFFHADQGLCSYRF